MSLSAIIITKNEERNIERVLKSVSFATERIVVDSNSTDRTVEIAKKNGAKVYNRDFRGYGNQKNFGAEQAQGEWLFFIDADEEVSLELRRGIEQVIEKGAMDFYWIKILTIFLNKPLRHLVGHNPRLFRSNAGYWTQDTVHEQVTDKSGVRVKLGDLRSKPLDGYLTHHSHQNIKSYLSKMHRYTGLDAKQMSNTNKHRSGRRVRATWWLPGYLSGRQLFKLLFYRGGIWDGWAGFRWCVLSAYYEWEMARKYLLIMNK